MQMPGANVRCRGDGRRRPAVRGPLDNSLGRALVVGFIIRIYHTYYYLLYEFGSEVLKHQNQIGSDVVLGFGPWLSLRTKFQFLVLSLASKE